MRERAIIPIIAVHCALDVRGAKFGFIFVRVVKFLNSIMCFLTYISSLAFPSFQHLVTHFRLVNSQGPPLILFLIMVIRASLQIVAILVKFARLDLK
jgi:hypothetical protein